MEMETGPSTRSIDTLPYYLYIIEGSIIVFFSTAMACIILLTPRFVRQKEYILLALNVLFDALFGLQYLLAGSHLLTVTVTNEFLPVTTRLACYTKLYVQLMIVLTPAMGVIALANALDRLYLITFPGKYHKLTCAYPFYVVGGALLCCVPTTVTAFVTVMSSAADHQIGNCLVQDTIPVWLQYVLRIIRIVTTVVAIPLYLPIIVKIKKMLETSGAVGNTQKKEIKLTITIALITINQLALFTIPDILILVIGQSFTFFVFNLNKGVVNLIIIMYCQRDIRQHIFRFGRKNSRFDSSSVIAAKNSSIIPAKNSSKVVAAIRVSKY